MHVHILGICGSFMGGIAAIAKSLGHKVTGSDKNVYPPMSTQLEALGIELTEGYCESQFDPVPDMVVIGNAMSRGNPAVEYVLNRNLPYTSGPQWLLDNLLKDRWVIGLSGTHGKTTTSSMVAWILEHAGLNPGYLIGGVPENFGVSARVGESPFFVIEADEYDSAFFDKRSKFVHYRPKTLVINNLEFDHADIFADLGAIQTQFHHNGVIAGTVTWSLLGQHNVDNALMAIAAAHHAGVTLPDAIEALSFFKNVKRRMEVKGEVNNITLYDDFAHHPTAIATTLDGLRKKVGNARILAVLEPRSNTMRMGVHKDTLANSWQKADEVYLYEPEGMDWSLVDSVAHSNAPTHCFRDVEKIVQGVCNVAQPGDHILVMSNGGFEGIHGRILDALKMKSKL